MSSSSNPGIIKELTSSQESKSPRHSGPATSLSSTKSIPMAPTSDFKTLVEEHRYVDKSLFIRDLLTVGSEATLLLRPPGFGKTVTLSMLRYFFEKSDTDYSYLFSDLAIWGEEKYRGHQGKYPVVYLDFNTICGTTYEEFYAKLKEYIANIFKIHAPNLFHTLNEDDQKDYEKILNKEGSKLKTRLALRDLLTQLAHLHDKKVILLVDGLDTLLSTSCKYKYFPELENFVMRMLEPLIKDNVHLNFALVMGTISPPKAGEFSGLNNVSTRTMLNDCYAQYFGFNQKEVQQLLLRHSTSDKCLSEIETSCGGYSIGNLKLMHPALVFNYINHMKDNSSSPKAIALETTTMEVLLEFDKSTLKSVMMDLMAEGINLDNMDLQISLQKTFKDPKNISAFLVLNGYATWEKVTTSTYHLTIPNLTVRNYLTQQMPLWFTKTKLSFASLLSCINSSNHSAVTTTASKSSSGSSVSIQRPK